MLYDIAFTRIGHHEAIPPITVATGPHIQREPADVITSYIHAYARQYLVPHRQRRGREIEVDVELTDTGTGSGSIHVAEHHVGDFTVRPRILES
jgi:hypothetical protein